MLDMISKARFSLIAKSVHLMGSNYLLASFIHCPGILFF